MGKPMRKLGKNNLGFKVNRNCKELNDLNSNLYRNELINDLITIQNVFLREQSVTSFENPILILVPTPYQKTGDYPKYFI